MKRSALVEQEVAAAKANGSLSDTRNLVKTTKTTKTVAAPVKAVANNDTTKPTLAVLETQFGNALREIATVAAEIRARKLYAPKYDNFSDYAMKELKTTVPVVWNAAWKAAQAANGDAKPTKAAKSAKAVQPAVAKAPLKKAGKTKPEAVVAA